jgi:hypothetical protein
LKAADIDYPLLFLCPFTAKMWRKNLMKKSKIKIIRVYEGTRSAREILTEAIACKVRRKLDCDSGGKRIRS